MKTGIENLNEPDWFGLEGNIGNPGIKYTESQRQCPNKKGAEFKKKYNLKSLIKKNNKHHKHSKKNYNGD